MKRTQTPFEIEFFTNAIDANAYDIAFYLLSVHEDEILKHSNLAIETHVNSYHKNKQFLKAKLHMSKQLMSIFNFKSAKVFLEILQRQVYDTQMQGNIFSHSANPLLNMCLLYELLTNFITKFFSLNNTCKTLMRSIMTMALEYIQSVDDENFLTTILLDKDYAGRDALRIAVELELLELVQTPKVEAVIKRIYYSDYDQDGSIMEVSSSYQAVFG